MNDRLVLTGIIGFLLGILFGSLYIASWGVAGLLALFGATFVSLYLLARKPLYIGTCILMFACALGVTRVALMPRSLPDAFVPLLGTTVMFEGVVEAPPDIRETSQRISTEVVQGNEKTNILVVTELYPPLHLGQRVSVTGTLTLPEPFETGGGLPGQGRVFRYDRFLAKDGIFSMMHHAHVEIIGERTGASSAVFGFISDIKPAFIHGLETALSEPHASLAGGLVAGGKQGLGDALVVAFITTGLIHIVVLSGYNVMIVAEGVLRFFRFVLRNVKKRESIASGVAGLTILAFVLIAGAGSASIRAGCMALVALFARATGRTYDAIRALLFIGLFMLVWNPLLLAYDPGFQLSFVATLGLIVGAPIFETRFFHGIQSEFLRSIISSTVAAQIAVLPLLLYQTGLLSLIALPANLLVLPVVPFAMGASALAGLAGLLIPTLAPVFGIPALAVLSYIIFVVETATAFPIAAVSVPSFSFVLVVCAYALLGYGVQRFRSKTPLPPQHPKGT